MDTTQQAREPQARRLSPQRAESAARIAARIAARKRGVSVESAWAGVEPLIAQLPGVGARVLERARLVFVATYAGVER